VRANYTRIIMEMEFELDPHQQGGATLSRTSAGWRLEMPSGLSQTYRLAQLDDYAHAPRTSFKHAPAWSFSLRARLSHANLPGTWGFGLWNDPFGLSLGFGGRTFHLPTLPQAVWYFHASPPNWLALQDSIPANGFFAGTLRSPRIPSLVLAPGLLLLPLCAIRPISRFLRKLAGKIIHQDGMLVDADVTLWHEYSIVWENDGCTFHVDGKEILSTPISPRPPLGLVIWIDNQYAAWTPQGRLAYSTLENPISWLELDNLVLR
jgi:hypothetical protein